MQKRKKNWSVPKPHTPQLPGKDVSEQCKHDLRIVGAYMTAERASGRRTSRKGYDLLLDSPLTQSETKVLSLPLWKLIWKWLRRRWNRLLEAIRRGRGTHL